MAKDRPTDESLTQLGIDPADPAQAVDKLWSLRAGGSVGDMTIALAASEVGTQEAAQLLVEMEKSASGPARREIRRALFRLRQRGIEPAREARAPEPRREAASESNLGAVLSPIDGAGARLVWLLKARTQGGLHLLQGLTLEEEGLRSVIDVEHIGRKQLREERREIEQSASVKLIDADWQLADFILCEAFRRTPEEQRAKVGNFLTLRAEILAGPPPVEYHHPIYDEFAASLVQEPSMELLKEPEVARWRFNGTDLKPFLEEIAGIRESPLILNQYQQEERMRAVADHAIAHLFTGERGVVMRRRFEDVTYYLARTGRKSAASWAASAAVRIRDGEDLRRIPFFVNWVLASFRAELSEQQAQAEQEPRLIITPAEMLARAARARAASARRTQ